MDQSKIGGIFLVGGAVRDIIMGRNPRDFDFSVETDSFDLLRELIKQISIQVFVEQTQFATIKAKVRVEFVNPTRQNLLNSSVIVSDFVLCRKDGIYRDHRRPQTVTGGTIYDDLERRDFTINAMALRCTLINKTILIHEDMIDCFGGVKDISSCILRTVGLANDKFNDDALRIIRAIRFMVIFNFEASEEIIECLNNSELVESIKYVSKERIQQELSQCFNYNTSKTLNTMFRFPHLFRVIFCELKFTVSIHI